MVESMLEKHSHLHYKPSRSLHQSSLKIDYIDHDNVDPTHKEKLVQEYQSIVGGLNWLTINTRPDFHLV